MASWLSETNEDALLVGAGSAGACVVCSSRAALLFSCGHAVLCDACLATVRASSDRLPSWCAHRRGAEAFTDRLSPLCRVMIVGEVEVKNVLPTYSDTRCVLAGKCLFVMPSHCIDHQLAHPPSQGRARICCVRRRRRRPHCARIGRARPFIPSGCGRGRRGGSARSSNHSGRGI